MADIGLDTLQEMFDNIAATAGWDMQQPMLWGYFFEDESSEKLSDASYLLEDMGFSMVKLFMPETNNDERPNYVLHMERKEVHTPASLFALNATLSAFADQHALASYDGMDVGPVV